GAQRAPGPRPSTRPVRRARLARDVLHDRDGTFADERDRHRVGAHTVAGDAARGVGSTQEVRDGLVRPIGAYYLLAALVLATVIGCAGPASHSPGPYTALDKDTEYRIDDRPGGFRVSVNRSRYQFFPDFSEMRHSCVSS